MNVYELQRELDSTDRYSAKKVDTGEPIPEQVRIRRAELRSLIRKIRYASSLGVEVSEVEDPEAAHTYLGFVEYELQQGLRNGFLLAGHRIQADPIAQQNATGFMTAIAAGVPVPFPILWRTLANENYFIPDLATFQQFAGAMLAFVQSAFHAAWKAKDSIRAVSTSEEMEAILETFKAHFLEAVE